MILGIWAEKPYTPPPPIDTDNLLIEGMFEYGYSLTWLENGDLLSESADILYFADPINPNFVAGGTYSITVSSAPNEYTSPDDEMDLSFGSPEFDPPYEVIGTMYPTTDHETFYFTIPLGWSGTDIRLQPGSSELGEFPRIFHSIYRIS